MPIEISSMAIFAYILKQSYWSTCFHDISSTGSLQHISSWQALDSLTRLQAPSHQGLPMCLRYVAKAQRVSKCCCCCNTTVMPLFRQLCMLLFIIILWQLSSFLWERSIKLCLQHGSITSWRGVVHCTALDFCDFCLLPYKISCWHCTTSCRTLLSSIEVIIWKLWGSIYGDVFLFSE